MAESEAPASASLLTRSRVQFTDEPLDWRTAIRQVGAPLIAEGAVTEGYVEEAIAIAERTGPFFHLGSGIAMPHARPEAGAKEVSLSFLRTRTPVLLLDQEAHPIDIFFMLSATDNESHIGMLQSLAGVLMDTERVARLKEADTVDQVLELVS